MTDWTQQIADFQRSCLEQQQQMLSGWFGTLQKAGNGAPNNVWRQALDSLEQQVNGALDTQHQSFKALLKTIEQAGNGSAELAHWERQAEAGMSFWNNMQHQLWRTWFEMLRDAAPARQEPAELLTQNWQKMMQQTMAMQEQWLSNWGGGQPTGKGASGKATKKAPAA